MKLKIPRYRLKIQQKLKTMQIMQIIQVLKLMKRSSKSQEMSMQRWKLLKRPRKMQSLSEISLKRERKEIRPEAGTQEHKIKTEKIKPGIRTKKAISEMTEMQKIKRDHLTKARTLQEIKLFRVIKIKILQEILSQGIITGM